MSVPSPLRAGIWTGSPAEPREASARRHAELRGWTVAEVYRPRAGGKNGGGAGENPERARMLADTRSGRIGVLIAPELAALACSAGELIELARHLQASQTALVSLKENLDTGAPEGALFLTLLGAVAQWEPGQTADSPVPGAAPGKAPAGGAALPFGFRRGPDGRPVEEPAEAEAMRLAFALFPEHRRKGVVARLLSARGFRTRGGRPFRDTQIDRMLRCAAARGTLVGFEAFDRVGRVLAGQKNPADKPGRTPAHLFSGLLTCGGCGEKLYVYTRSPSYTCARCKNRIGAAEMEEIFAGSLPEDLTAAGAGEAQSLFALWPALDRREKRRLLPLICSGITVPPAGSESEIDITFVTPGGAPPPLR